MKGQLIHWRVANTKSDYATCEDFCKLFANNVKRLYLLSFLLTADPQKAEQCFVSGLDDCMNGISAFQESVECWARRVIVRRAVRLIQPHPGDTVPRMRAFQPTEENTFRGIALL
jgi:hypothetical protein